MGKVGSDWTSWDYITNPETIGMFKNKSLNITGWWFQPLWKILVKMGTFPK